jgi:protoporphyrinogen oxidase
VVGLAGTPLLGWGQKLRLGAYAAAATALPVSTLLDRPDVEARQAWAEAGITEETVHTVLRPFLAGVVLEEEMVTSRRFVDLMLRMFARGRSTVPAAGMQALPEQLAADLPPGALRLGSPVSSVRPHEVEVDGQVVSARAVVVATDAWVAHELLPGLGAPPAARGVTTVYHSAPARPGQVGTLVTDADGSAVANSLVISAAAPSYAPPGRALVSTSVVHGPRGGTELDEAALLGTLSELHEEDTSGWERLATYDLPHALPAMTAPHEFRRPVRLEHEEGRVYVTGDHRDTSSIQGALVSGRRAAAAVVSDLA